MAASTEKSSEDFVSNSTKLEEIVEDLRQAIRRNKIDFSLSGGKRSRQTVLEEINRLRPSVENAAQALGFRPPPATVASEPLGWVYHEYSEWISEFIGFLGALSSTEVAVRSPDAVVDEAVISLLRAGHPEKAVLAAASSLESALQRCSGLTQGGFDLASKALSDRNGDLPRIVVRCGGTTEDEKNYREGIKLLVLGALRAFRNPQAHGDPVPLAELDCQHQVLALSYLRRVILGGGSIAAAEEPVPPS